MNQVAQLPKTMQPASVSAASLHISKLFAVMMTPNGGDFTKAIAADYAEAVQGIPEWAIAEASDDYRHGRIGNGKFAPTPGELAKEARFRFEAYVRREQERRAEARQIAENRERREMLASRTPEQKERVRRAHEMFKSSHAAYLEELAERDSGRADLMADMTARMHERFKDDHRRSEG